MGDVIMKCPLCCNDSFNTVELLVQHLSNIIGNLFCPICTSKWTSVAQLIKHLSHDNCSQLHNTQLRTILLEKTSEQDSAEIQINNSDLIEFKNAVGPIQNLEATDDVTSMYAELMKPTHQSDLEFMKDGDSQYVIITQDQDGTVVTKQNNDGTISMTTVNDSEMKIETNEYVTPDTSGSPEESQEALYSCNTCGVSFTSVIDHIRNYHNDQDVVVEEPIDETDEQIPIEYESVVLPTDKQTSRRVITETGVIVETPVKETESVQDKGQDRQQSTGSKRYLRLNNICDSVIRNLKQDTSKSNPSHKVLVKEVLTKDGELVKYYHCTYCNLNVTSLDNIKNQPCKSSKHSCLQCPVSYDNAKSLCAHMKVHKIKNTEVKESAILETFECEICCTVFPTNKSLKLHKRMHDPVKSRQIEAPKNSNFSEMRYLCTICQKMIPIDYRRIHENSHVDAETLNCGICNKKFTSKEYLEMHMNVHNLDKVKPSKQDLTLPYTCLYCERRFARPHEKVKHERIHTGEKPHSCDICGKSFRVSYCLTLHMRTHTGARPYCCTHCGKRFKAHSVYNHHLLTHSEVRAYKCPYCPKAFKTSVQLAGHKNSHTKPFSCTQCNRPFASLYAVRVHTETHSRQNNLKFSCSLCGASYARAFALKDHMKQAHKDHFKSENATEEWVHDEPECTATIKTIPTFDKTTNIVHEMEFPADELIIPN